MDKHLKSSGAKIPEDICFKELDLKRDRLTGAISFNLGVMVQVCQNSGVALEHFLSKNGNGNGNGNSTSDFLKAWYASHLQKGGEMDPVMDELIEEAMAG